MGPRAWLCAFALVLLPTALATSGTAGQIEVDAPVTIEGRADTWLPAGTASFVAASGTAPIAIHLKADDAVLVSRNAAPGCDGITLPGSSCPPGQRGVTDEEHVLSDLTLTVIKPLSGYKVVATTDRAHADTPTFGDDGRLLATTAATTRLGTNGEGVHLGMTDRAWQPDTKTNVVEPVYAAEPHSAEVSAGGAILRATGGFELFLQGVEVRVRGLDADGEIFEKTYDLRLPSNDDGTFRALILELDDGDLTATSSAPFVGYARADQRPVTDVHSRAKLTSATGTLDGDSSQTTLEKEDITIDGPVSLTLTKIHAAAQPRLTYTLADGLQLAVVDDPRDDPAIPPAALAAAGAAGAGGAGALIALGYFWPRLKYWATLLALPMYTRIERDAVLEHEKRDELYELIRTTPGIHAHEIGEKANIGWGTTVYHLKLLEGHGLIVSKKSGRYKRFFVNTGEYTKKKDVYGALRNETAKAVAQYIVDHPGTTQKEMCAALGIQPSLASWHVEKLEGVELVKRVKDGRMVRYFAGPAWADLNVRVDPRGGGDAPAEA